ncbi:MAG: aminotransferase class I/II-fold pyridoxal phosphate-dependent enzyme, partial [Actinomycetia bacterium]|nr:aminotransferase class I/II-fold pyridoxal phosphate-dependent enzyme [Actinomycetes bacterium]
MSVGRVRPSVAALPAYRPGKAAVQAEQEHGISNAIKLASNENPYPPAPSVIEAITAAASGVNRYPDHLAVELRHTIASWVGVEAEQVTAGCGSVGLLRQICMAYVDPGDEVVYPWLSFEVYPINVTTMGGVSVTVPLVDHAFDLDGVADAVTDRTKLVLLATPNNPTGTAISCADIATLASRIPDDVVIVVDEAYREFSDPALGDPVTDLLPNHQNVAVFRTFSKAYGLAGLRSGYAIADPEIIVNIDKLLLPFTNNGLAQAGAMAAITAADEIRPRIDELMAERQRLVEMLSGAGWKLPDAKANF